ncbi:hypothetical protein FQZ97_1216650 [compost metagenome]
MSAPDGAVALLRATRQVGPKLCATRDGFHEMRRDQDDQFLLAHLVLGLLEERAEHGDVAEQRDLVCIRGGRAADQTTDDEAFAVAEFDGRVGAARADGGNSDAADAE